MEFELSREIIAEIMFGMENQVESLVFDTESGKVLASGDVDLDDTRNADTRKEARFLPLPVWRPIEGFQLMERFTGTLHNPVIQEELRKALASGKGVFRNFKTVLKERKDVERLWFKFKEREMKRVVLSWYNDLVRTLGWGKKAAELSDYLEDTDELVREDFTLEDLSGNPEAFRETEKAVRNASGSVEAFGMSLGMSGKAYRFVSPDGRPAAFIWGTTEQSPGHGPKEGGGVMIIRVLYVFKDFRGLGLARELVKRFCADLAGKGNPAIRVTLPGRALFMASVFADLGFTVTRQVMERREDV